MPTRRSVLERGALLLGGMCVANCEAAPGSAKGAPVNGAVAGWRMPDEGEAHAATWMAFAHDADIWSAELIPAVQRNLADVAKAIAAHEPVRMLVREQDHDTAARLCGPSVDLVVRPVDDLWIRDTGPVFVKDPAGRLGGVDFNFNGWGDKQEHGRDAEVAGFVTREAHAQAIATKLVLEGGGIEVDGEGTAIITESCVLNPNRNPGLTKPDCERALGALLGLTKIIWLPGIAGKDITDGHTDFYARFAGPGVVVAGLENDPKAYDYRVTRRHLEILRGQTDAKGRPIRVVTMPGPDTVRETWADDDFAAGYINFYLCNGAVIAPEFGDRRADLHAREVLTDLFPGREVIQLNIDGIAAGGGGIHCATQQQPK